MDLAELKYYRYIQDPPCPGPREVHIFGTHTEKSEFQQFLLQNEVDAVIVEDTSLFKPRPFETRNEPVFGSWLQLFRRCSSGEYNLTILQRYIFEVMMMTHEFANLMRDGPLFLGEDIWTAFEESNEYTWIHKFCERQMQQSPILLRVHTSKALFAEQVRSQIEVKGEISPKPYPKSNELKEYMVEITEKDSPFEYNQEIFDLVKENREYLFVDVGPKSKAIFSNRWGRAYVHNLYEAATSGRYDRVAIVTDLDAYLDEISDLWGQTTEYDVKEIYQNEKRLSPRMKIGYGLIGFTFCSYFMRTRGPPALQKLAVFGSMCVVSGTIFSYQFMKRLRKLDSVVLQRSAEYDDFMTQRGSRISHRPAIVRS